MLRVYHIRTCKCYWKSNSCKQELLNFSFDVCTASESDLQCRRLKLDYEEITPCLKDVTLVWERMLSTTGRSKVRFDTEEIRTAVGHGNLNAHTHIHRYIRMLKLMWCWVTWGLPSAYSMNVLTTGLTELKMIIEWGVCNMLLYIVYVSVFSSEE